MKRKTFMTIASAIAFGIGLVATFLPNVLIETMKVAAPSETATVMATTAGVLLISFGFLNFLVRDHDDSPTLRAILISNILLQVIILPIDPLAYANGVFTTLGSFLPNVFLHSALAIGFGYYLMQMRNEAVG